MKGLRKFSSAICEEIDYLILQRPHLDILEADQDDVKCFESKDNVRNHCQSLLSER